MKILSGLIGAQRACPDSTLRGFFRRPQPPHSLGSFGDTVCLPLRAHRGASSGAPNRHLRTFGDTACLPLRARRGASFGAPNRPDSSSIRRSQTAPPGNRTPRPLKNYPRTHGTWPALAGGEQSRVSGARRSDTCLHAHAPIWGSIASGSVSCV